MSKKAKSIPVLIILAMVLSMAALLPGTLLAWGTDPSTNTPVVTADGRQQAQRIIADGSGMFKEATVLFDGFDGIGTKHAEYYANVLLPIHQEMFLGTITPDEFIEKMKAETVTYWETH